MNKKLFSLLIILFLALAGCSPALPPQQPVSDSKTDSTSLSASPTEQPASGSIADSTFSTNSSTGFILTSPDLPMDGRLPVEYTCDGESSTLALNWSGAPAEVRSYTVIMHHVASPDDIHWYWVLYNIPAEVTSLSKNISGVGKLGNNINNGLAEYSPPCSRGPGDKEYIYTIYALSAVPQISLPAEQVTRDVMLAAIENITLASDELHVVYARQGMDDQQAQSSQPSGATQPQPQGGGTPPTEAFAACDSKVENTSCEFSDQNGSHTGVCRIAQDTLACAPSRDEQDGQQGKNNQSGNNQPTNSAPAYNIEQAISDKAQGMTIAYDAVAFLTGDLGSNSFFPPGKVADFWGFQYLRDNDPSEMGHAGDFLTSAAMNTLYNLTPEQRADLVTLAESQVALINEYGYMRFMLIDAFNRLLEGDLPAGTTGLNEGAIEAYSAELYRLDGEISFDRAALMGNILNNLSAEQSAYFDAMVGRGMLEWPDVEEPADMRSLDRDVKVAMMTYAADMYSWYAGSVEADVYFCPERHGTYFGSFYLKDIHAMNDSSYAIPTDITGNVGEAMLETLAPDQSQMITSLVDVQKPSLLGIVDIREQVSIELRKFLSGGTADKALVLNLMEEYGALDGTIIYNYATNFAQVNQTLTAEQKAQLMSFREEMLSDLMYPSGAYLYSQAIPMPEIQNTDFLFK